MSVFSRQSNVNFESLETVIDRMQQMVDLKLYKSAEIFVNICFIYCQ
jgi:hypothetical protein